MNEAVSQALARLEKADSDIVGGWSAELPTYLYRYRRFRHDQEKQPQGHVRRAILCSSLKYGNPDSFNDVDEGLVEFAFEATNEQIEANCIYLGTRGLLPEILARRSDPSFQQETVGRLKRRASEMGVLCLATAHDESKMWDEYGDQHRGVCLRFRMDRLISPDESRSLMAFPVRYVGTRNPLPYFTTPAAGRIAAWLGTKSPGWQHEAEWRVVRDEPGEYPFEPDALDSIVVGEEMPPDALKLLCDLVGKRDRPIRLFTETGNAV